MDKVNVQFRGKQITAALNGGQTPSGQVLSREEPAMWYVTIGSTALTKLPAAASDTETAVKGRVLEWLEAHPDMLDRDQIILGGG